jgi:glyoxylase-like metal-dependent hydrolase (beta-lactamase superfamily II)
MNVRVLPAGLIQTNAYLLTDPARGEAVLIDAPGEIWEQVGPILGAERCTLRGVWLTHGHWDHTQGAAEVVRRTGAAVVAHRADQALIETPEMMRAFLIPGLVLEPVRVDRWVAGGERLAAVGGEAEVRHVPGHCPGNILFHFAAAGVAFVGDALFRGNVGRTDLPGGNFAELERSIRTQIYTLPEATVVYPGHGGSTTVGEEMRGNPYVAA